MSRSSFKFILLALSVAHLKKLYEINVLFISMFKVLYFFLVQLNVEKLHIFKSLNTDSVDDIFIFTTALNSLNSIISIFYLYQL